MPTQRSLLLAALGTAATLAASAVTVTAGTATSTAATPVVFSYTGAAQTYVVPAGVSALAVDVRGAAGDDAGGYGGRVNALLPVAAGETLKIHVGGAGNGALGGWNGGGNASWYDDGFTSGGGGGASDIRGGTGSLAERLVVAGGGGGGTTVAGGHGGGTTGQRGNGSRSNAGYGDGGGGGTQVAGGEGGEEGDGCPCGGGSDGTFGNGGAGAGVEFNFGTGSSNPDHATGGGGGGWFGGGGGGYGAVYGSGGGGGSSYTIPGASQVQHYQGVQAGHGEVRLTPVAGEPLPSVGPLPQLLPAPPAGGVATSDDCTVTAGDGFVGSTYVRLATRQVDARTTWVCVRVEDAAGVGTGGKFVVNQAAGVSGTPTTDGAVTQCATASGNTVPGPHPLLPGSIGDPSDPSTYATYLLDAYAGNGAAWVCARVTAGSQAFGLRVVVPVPSVAVPAVTFLPDAPGQYAPAPATHPALPSGACQASTTGTRAEYVNVTSALGSVWLGSWRESATRVHVCVGSGGLRPAGGRLTLEVPLPTVTPVVTTGGDMAACPLSVAQQGGAAPFAIRRSGATNPASVCVEVAGRVVTVTLGANAGAGVPVATWTGDPGTP